MSSSPAKTRLFCSRPFEHLNVATPAVPGSGQRGGAYLCCTGWLPVSIGNLKTSTVAEVWNGEVARKIRRSILDGSFRYCERECAFLQSATGPVQAVEDVTDVRLKEIIDKDLDIIPDGPRTLNAAFDLSCNLSCPSCRTEHIIESQSQTEIIQLQHRLANEAFHNLEVLTVSGSGDAFGSPFFLRWLRTLKVSQYPKLRIHVHTNAQLWTAPIWAKIPEEVRERIFAAEISIDAATEKTYALNRRGGEWSVLLSNLELIARLRANGPLQHLKFDFVVQENNFQEMPGFVELARAHAVDNVQFTRLVNWGTYSKSELRQRSIHIPSHPRHGELLEVLRDPRLQHEIVNLGNLSDLVTGAESHTSFQTEFQTEIQADIDAQIHALTPILRTVDLEGSVRFYTSVLGFTCSNQSATWASMKRGQATFMLLVPDRRIQDREPSFTGSLYFSTDDVDEFWRTVKDRARISYELETFPYGMREFGIYDNNGYLLQFGQPVTSSTQ